MSNTVLGLDLGSNSIGWSLIDECDQQPCALRDLGVRIFIRSVEDKTPTPKNHARRAARLLRRVLQRRARRRQRLQNYLIHLQLLPAGIRDVAQRETVLNQLGDPYALRRQGLDQALTPYQLGRAILHIGARRGFLSNRRALLSDMAGDPDVQAVLEEEEAAPADMMEVAKEEGEFKAAIAALQGAILQHGARTLGEYLAQLPPNERKRNRRIGREMLRYELELLLAVQAPSHIQLTEAVQEELAHIIFYQRPLRWDRGSIGNCSLQPALRRTRAARLEYQRFRIWQDLNHLRYQLPYQLDSQTGELQGGEQSLRADDKHKLLDVLEQQASLSWGRIRSLLGLPKTIRFNLEQAGSKSKGLTGNHTACDIRRIWSGWDQLDDAGQHQLVDDLLSFEKRSALKRRLIHHWQFDTRTAVQLAMLDLEPGYGNHSLKVTRQLLSHLQQGLRYDEARVATGYGYQQETQQALERLPAPPDTCNPIVNRALHEVRRVVNAIIAQYGKPSAIRIELPREISLSGKRKAAWEKQQKANEKANDDARTRYQEVRNANPQLNLPAWPGKTELLKYRLWKEQEGECPYSGRAISLTALFSSAVEIEHILPYSRTLDDSYMNKVVAYAEENRQKGNRTPREWLSGDTLEQVLARVKKLPSAKREAFHASELPKDFLNSQLSDTAWISKEVYRYVASLGCDVSVSKGQATAWLRRQWGLNRLLGSDTKQRDDHRHHAIDATVVALTSRSLYQQVARLAEQQLADGPAELSLPLPWPQLPEQLEARLANLTISHDVQRKLSGAFHELTAYGLQARPDGGQRMVYRKQLDEKFDAKQIGKVVDAALQARLIEHLTSFGGDAKRAFAEGNRPAFPGQAPLRRIRVIASDRYSPESWLSVRDRQGRTYKYHLYGNNHHVEILRHKGSGKYEGRFVTTWEAARRARCLRQPMVQTQHGDDWEFIMALHIGDLVDAGGRRYRVQKLDATNDRLSLRLHTAATLEHDHEAMSKAVNVLMKEYQLQQIKLNVLGHIQA